MERPAYSITLEDLGAQVQWRLTRDGETVAESAVPIGDASLPLPRRLAGAYDAAYFQADKRRRERFQRDLEPAVLAATREQQVRYQAVQLSQSSWLSGTALPWAVRDTGTGNLVMTGEPGRRRTWQTSLRQVALDEATRLNNEHERVEGKG